jgi:hypothetical protein
MSQQTRSTDALAAAAANARASARAARNVNRYRGHNTEPPRHQVGLDNLVEALCHIEEITGSLAKVVEHYADAVRWPISGYEGTPTGWAATFRREIPRDAYPTTVVNAADLARQALTTLAHQLRSRAPVGFSTDAIANLDVALHDCRMYSRRNPDSARR